MKEDNIDISPKFEIKDDILYNCIGLGAAAKRKEDNDNIFCSNEIAGFRYGKNTFGYALLSYFTARALGIKRFPLCEDRIYAEYCNKYDRFYNYDEETLSQLTEKRVNSICCEIIDLYNHTQNYLKTNNRTSIKLTRVLEEREASGYTGTIIMLKKACEMLKKTSFNIDMDTLNSFGNCNSDNYGGCNHVTITLEVPSKNILYTENIIKSRDAYSMTEPGEWVVINRSPNGIVEIPLSSVGVHKTLWQKFKFSCDSDAENFLRNYTPFQLKSLSNFHLQNHEKNKQKMSLKGRSLSFLHKIKFFPNL